MRTPAQAIAYALTQQRWPPSMCLNFVWSCYAPDNTITSNLTAYGYPPPITRAIDGWNASPMRHQGDRNPDIGAPVYYTATTTGPTAGDGHIALYIGGGMIRTTDAAAPGINATVPLDWPEHNWGRHYLGWTGDILGWPLTPAPAPLEALIPYTLIPDATTPTIYVCSTLTGRRHPIACPYHATILTRYKNNPGTDRMLPAELDIAAAYLQLIHPTSNPSGGLTDADVARLTQAINDDAARRMAS